MTDNKHQDPELYDSRKLYKTKFIYSRICQKPYQPIIISDKEYKQLDKEQRDKAIKYWNFTSQKPTWYLSINPKYNKLGKNTIGCRRLPHGKFQFQVHLKKDVHQLITNSERESLWAYLKRNEENCLVTNKYVLDYLIGKYPHCYHGYFYISEQKMLTPIYMLAQKAIDKVIKYVKVKNESNKKTKRT